jgi:hypothetical protein
VAFRRRPLDSPAPVAVRFSHMTDPLHLEHWKRARSDTFTVRAAEACA